jgi:hypothetical protein
MKGIEKLRGLNNSKAVPMIPELFGRVQDAVIDDAFAKEKAAKVAGFLSKNDSAEDVVLGAVGRIRSRR